MFAAKNEFFTPSQGYQISRSVRLRSSASAYFNRTPASSGNSQKFTLSWWVKRGTLSAQQVMFGINSASTNIFTIIFQSNDTFRVLGRVAGVDVLTLTTTQVFRDPSAWYHVVVAIDTTQATAANRALMYVNGVQVTAFGTATYPAQNTNLAWNNSSYSHQIGREDTGNYFDGYFTEMYNIDGQALTPTSFGQFNSVTGVWQPIKYTGTYGTNGFYLNFSDNSAATAAAIGKDYSGNGNNWTPNNISVTSGATYDSMIDVPTLYADGGNGRGNYCTFNPNLYNAGSVTYSDANLKMAMSSSVDRYNLGTIGVSSGKWYWEIVPSGFSTSSDVTIGICKVTRVANGPWTAFGGPDTINFNTGNGWSVYGSNIGSATGTIASGDVIGVALDMDGNNLYIYKNNVLLTSRSGSIDLTTPHTLFVDTYFTGSSAVLNCGQRPFAYTPPSGFNALNTQNLPAPTISNGALYMAATLYTGNGTSQTVTNTVNGVSFTPDLVWNKGRSVAYSHSLVDVLRGNSNILFSNTTDAESNPGAQLDITTNGFISTYRAANLANNQNGATYVGWQWKAGGSGSSNTSGSITSTVSVNATAGFSVVTYTGTGANATVGHGLGVAPNMVIVKERNAVRGWPVYHSSLTSATYYVDLQTTAAQASASTIWNSTAPTSTVFSIGTDTGTNQSTGTYVAYCFSAVRGYSAFGSYTGNGSTDGPFVYLGFRPRFILYKNASFAGTSWAMLDSSRNTYNVENARLFADSSGAEDTSVSPMDFTSNGFKVRSTNDGVNRSGDTIIYAAFAENPFKNALAR